MTTRPFTPVSSVDFVSSGDFGSEIPIVKFSKVHRQHIGDKRRLMFDKWNFLAKIIATA
jgi:hypothetical protein